MRRICGCLVAFTLIAYQFAITGAMGQASGEAPAAPMPCHQSLEPSPAADPDGPGQRPDPCPLMLGVVCMANCAVLPEASQEPVVLAYPLVHFASAARKLMSLAVPPPQRPPKSA